MTALDRIRATGRIAYLDAEHGLRVAGEMTAAQRAWVDAHRDELAAELRCEIFAEFEERAAILEHDQGLPRDRAEAEAFEDAVIRHMNRTPGSQASRHHCAAFGHGGGLIAVLASESDHAWLHAGQCHDRWRARRYADAMRALAFLNSQTPEEENLMPFYVSDTGGGDFTPCPAGVWAARCVRVLDLGLIEGNFGIKRTALVSWEVAAPLESEPGKFHTISKRYTPSLSPKANLRRDLVSWRGRDFTPEELGRFDLAAILGAPCTLSIVHTQKGDATYADVSAIMPAQPGSQPFEGAEPLILYSADDPATEANLAQLSEKLQAFIREGVARLRASKSSHPASQPAQPPQQPHYASAPGYAAQQPLSVAAQPAPAPTQPHGGAAAPVVDDAIPFAADWRA